MDRFQIELPRGFGKSSMAALIQWTTKPKMVLEEHDDERRCNLMNKITKATKFSIYQNHIAFRVDDGKILATKVEQDGCKLVWFDYLEDGANTRERFWFNESSVLSILELATSKKENEVCLPAILQSNS